MLTGALVRLTAFTRADLDALQPAYQQADFIALSSDRAVYPPDPEKIWQRIQDARQQKTGYRFAMRLLADDTLIGDIGFKSINWHGSNSEIGMGIGAAAQRGKGYGTDALRVLLRYGFMELNLHRVYLTVNGYNTAAQRAYTKAGFKTEVTLRQYVFRYGAYHDVYVMGILRHEWVLGQDTP